MGSDRPTLSVVIVTLNEEEKLEECLESVKWADEIVVLDSISQDRTVEIARRYTDKVSQRRFLGHGPMRNAAIESACGEWILCIDADERVTPELRAEIEQALAAPDARAYRMPRKAYFLGKWIRHCGWWPDYVLRLFRKDEGRYDDSLVHEQVVVGSMPGILRSPLLHFTYANIGEYLKKTDSHTTWYAREEGHRASLPKCFLRAFAKFGKSYFLQRGFLDGREGLILSVLASYSTFIKHLKVWEANRGP